MRRFLVVLSDGVWFVVGFSNSLEFARMPDVMDERQNGNQQPTLDDLVETLTSLFTDSGRTYLLVNAQDEV